MSLNDVYSSLSKEENDRRIYFKEKAEREGHHDFHDVSIFESGKKKLTPLFAEIVDAITDSGLMEMNTGGNIRSVDRLPDGGVLMSFRLAETSQAYVNHNMARNKRLKELQQGMLKEMEECWSFILKNYADDIDVKVFFTTLSGRWSPLFYNIAIKLKENEFPNFPGRMM